MQNLNSIRILISEGNLKEALGALLKQLESTDRNTRKLRDGVIILYSKFQDLTRKETLGLIETDDALREKGQINEGLLNIISDIETGTAPMSAVQTPKTPQQWWWLLLLLIPAGVVVFWNDMPWNSEKGPLVPDVIARQASLSMEETTFDFGTVIAGNTVSHTFLFRNTGDTALIIAQVQASSSYTVKKQPQNPIPPGEKGEITIEFETHGKSGQQNGQITIYSNSNPSPTILATRGNVQGVIRLELPVARFRIVNGGCVAPCTVQFTNESQNAEVFSWAFGDGGASSLRNPAHRYQTAGVYQVRLVTRKGGSSDSELKSLTIISPPPPPHCDAWVQNWVIINENHNHLGTAGKYYTSSEKLLNILDRLDTRINGTLRNTVIDFKSAIMNASKVTEYGPGYDLEFTTQLRNMKTTIADQIRMQVIQCGKTPQDYSH